MKKILFASAAILLSSISTQAEINNNIAKKNNTNQTKVEKRENKKAQKENNAITKAQDANSVAYQSKEEFYRNFGDHPDAAWSATNAFDKVIFNNNGVATTAYYDFEASLVGTTSLTTFESLPVTAQKQISKDYKDYTVKSVVFFDDNENNNTNMVLYNNAFDDEDNYFVELQKDNKTIIVQVTMDGLTGYFTGI